MSQTLWLIGMMGSGKSTVAPAVADLLGKESADMDGEVSRATGRRAAEILEKSEAAFRIAERSAVRVLAGRSLVIACGGGVVTSPESVGLMRRDGLVVWLQALPETLAGRVAGGDDRPLLVDGAVEALHRIEAERLHLYGAAAHEVVVTDGRSVAEVVGEVVRVWQIRSSVE